jgi:repressor LexA
MMADYFHIEKSDLVEARNLSKKTQARRIPVLGRVAAGVPLEMVEEVIDWEEVSEAVAASGAIFALQIHGSSMEPRILDGDVVIIPQQDDAESGDVVIASVNGDDATCKRLRKYKEGIELIPLNPSFAPMFFSNQDIAEKPVRILGKVIELRGKF